MDRKDSYLLRSAYKSNDIGIEESRKRRHDEIIALRKSKKEDLLLMRRDICDSDKEVTSPQLSVGEIVDAMNSTDENRLVLGLSAARSILSCEHDPPSDVIALICIRLLLSAPTESLLHLEAAYTLTSIGNGYSDQTHCLIEHNAVPHFVAMLQSDNMILANQAVQALAKIAGNGATTRDCVLQYNVIDGILSLINRETSLLTLRNIVWLMSNLCRNKNPSPRLEQVRRLLPTLSQLLHNQDIQVLADACWALSYVTNCDDRNVIQAVIDANVVSGLVRLLTNDEPSINEPALRTVANIVTGTDQQTDVVIDSGGLPCLAVLLQHHKSYIVEEAALVVSNITTGNRRHIQAIIEAGLFEPLRHVLETGDFKAQREAAWAVTNTLTLGSPTQILHMIERYQILESFIDLLEAWDPATINVVLAGLRQLFFLAERLGCTANLCRKIEEVGGLRKLEKLQYHMQGVLHEKANVIVDTYFRTTVQGGEDGPKLALQEINGGLDFKLKGGKNF
ncbi:hypothetical protein KR032_005650 [Drosophila birchii]|nr:hypothetical protein KR032_005650 [Drosophila birchii]